MHMLAIDIFLRRKRWWRYIDANVYCTRVSFIYGVPVFPLARISDRIIRTKGNRTRIHSETIRLRSPLASTVHMNGRRQCVHSKISERGKIGKNILFSPN